MYIKARWSIGATVLAGLLIAGVTINHGSPHPTLTTAAASTGYANLDDCPTLEEGYQGGCVNQLQTELNGDENAGLTVDGSFGAATKQAVVTFQQANGIAPADGIVGPQTKQALDTVTPASAPPASPAAGDTATPANLEECPTLAEGYHGGCVNELQNELNFDDNAGLTADGTFGPTTRQAVVAFQQANDLIPADGIVGQQTKLALLNADSVPTPQPGAPLTPFEVCQAQGPGLISDGHGGCTHDGVTALGKSPTECLNDLFTEKLNDLLQEKIDPDTAEKEASAWAARASEIYDAGEVFKCALLDNPDS